MTAHDCRPGLQARVALRVGRADTARAMRSGDVALLATPRVLALAEQAAVAAVAGCLTSGTTSVGAWAEIDHLAPNRVGDLVVAHARLLEVDGRRLLFAVRVTDETGRDVARVRHRRAVVPRPD